MAEPAECRPASRHDLHEGARLFLKLGWIGVGGPAAHIALMRDEVVRRRQWLADQQLLDAAAIGLFTPGPLFTAGTFIDYLIGIWPGAIVATVGIFLPSFVFVAVSQPFIPRLRQSLWTSSRSWMG